MITAEEFKTPYLEYGDDPTIWPSIPSWFKDVIVKPVFKPEYDYWFFIINGEEYGAEDLIKKQDVTPCKE
jgi:hypothetical protein